MPRGPRMSWVLRHEEEFAHWAGEGREEIAAQTVLFIERI